MPRQGAIIDYNRIYHSNNYGDFIILEELPRSYDGRRMIRIKFLNTDPINPEHIEICKLTDAMRGEVKDHYLKIICGVACIGHANSVVNGSLDRHYRVWSDMIHRTYDPNYKDYYNYGGAGVSICPKWLCYEFFLQDVMFIKGYEDWWNNPGCYELDKDTLQANIDRCNKVYSLDTCAFIPSIKNAQYASVTKDNKFSKYVGVTKGQSNRFRCRIGTKQNRINLGSYDDEIAAANIYNCYAYEYNVRNNTNRYMINNVPYMTPNEIREHSTSSFPGVPLYILRDK